MTVPFCHFQTGVFRMNKIKVYLNVHGSKELPQALTEVSEALHAFQHRHGKAEIEVEVEITPSFFVDDDWDDEDDEFFD